VGYVLVRVWLGGGETWSIRCGKRGEGLLVFIKLASFNWPISSAHVPTIKRKVSRLEISLRWNFIPEFHRNVRWLFLEP
jgi:hypothetical protein